MASTGAALAEAGRKVLLIDLDPQACLTFAMGIEPDEVQFTVTTSCSDGSAPHGDCCDPGEPDLLPSLDRAVGCGDAVGQPDRPGYVLREALAEVADDYDVVLIDCSPSLGVLTINALTAATEVLIPMQAETSRTAGSRSCWRPSTTCAATPTAICGSWGAADHVRRPHAIGQGSAR